MKFNVLNNLKKICICFTVFVLIGITILSIFGLNLGPELAGHIEIKIGLGQYNIVEENAVKEETEEIVKLLKENSAKVLQTNIEDSGFTSKLLVSIKNVSSVRDENVEFAKKLSDALKNHYNNDELMVIKSTVVSGIMTNVSGVKLAYTLLITLIVIMFYFMFRFKLLNSICILATTLVSFVTFFTLVTLSRVQVNTSIFGIITLTVIFSLVVSVMKYADLKTSRIEKLPISVGELQFNQMSTKIYGVTILGMLILIIFGSLILKNFAIMVILSVISLWFAENFVCLPLCYYLNNTTVEKPKQIIKKDEEESEKAEIA